VNINEISPGKAVAPNNSAKDGTQKKSDIPAKEDPWSNLKSGDNIIAKTLRNFDASGLNPFGVGVNTAKNPVDDSTVKGSLAKQFVAMKGKLDINKDGFVSKGELLNKMADPNIKGAEAALVGTLISNQGKLKNLSNDITTFELKGVTTGDIVALDKLPYENKVRDNIDNSNFNNYIKILNSADLHGADGKLKLPQKASDIDYKDLQQGSTGDCYFLAALASLAQRQPQKIVDMIQDNKNGTYTIKFPAKSVTINAPTDTELGLYGSGKAWVPIMEKGYAKLRNDKFIIPRENPYDLIGGGSAVVGRAMQELTGNTRDTDMLLTTPKDTTRQKLKNAVANNKLMVASINKEIFGKNEFNLPDGHVYTVLDYNSKTDKVKLRNPWGYTEASDKSGNPLDGVDDGIFELTLAQFDKTFSQISYEK
jgi:hypothetical protein